MATRRKSAGKQRLYRMKGCNKKGCKKTKRRHLGGSAASYPNAYPNPGPVILPESNLFLNPQMQRGGCGCGAPLLSGGSAQRGGCGCGAPLLSGGSAQRGGLGNESDTFVGKPWTSNLSTWSGVDGANGNGNHYQLNDYKVDPQTAMISTGAQSPFLGGSKRKNKRTKKQRGGNLSNFLSQDLINLGRQFQFGLGTAYNGISGYSAPVSPLPWKGQMQSVPNLATVKAAMM